MKTCADCLHWGDWCIRVTIEDFTTAEDCPDFVDVSVDNPKLADLMRTSVKL